MSTTFTPETAAAVEELIAEANDTEDYRDLEHRAYAVLDRIVDERGLRQRYPEILALIVAARELEPGAERSRLFRRLLDATADLPRVDAEVLEAYGAMRGGPETVVSVMRLILGRADHEARISESLRGTAARWYGEA